MTLHTQPGGEVIATSTSLDGRTLRVCGTRPYRGCSVCYELYKWLRWEKTSAQVKRTPA